MGDFCTTRAGVAIIAESGAAVVAFVAAETFADFA